MSHHSVCLAPHDSNWAVEFERVSSSVEKVLSGVLIAIHPIGSTAIPGISAQPKRQMPDTSVVLDQ